VDKSCNSSVCLPADGQACYAWLMQDERDSDKEATVIAEQYPWLHLTDDCASMAAEWRRTFIFDKMADKDWSGTALVDAMTAIDTWLSTGTGATATSAKILALKKR